MTGARDGFTLLELIVVIVIMTVFASLIMPRFTAQLHSARRRACFEDLTTVVRMARFQAVETGRRQEVRFDLEHETVALVGNGAPSITKILPRGMDILSVSQGAKQKTTYGVVKVPFLVDGTTMRIQVRIRDGNERGVVYEIDGATGAIAAK